MGVKEHTERPTPNAQHLMIEELTQEVTALSGKVEELGRHL
jgi:hypothetical protein